MRRSDKAKHMAKVNQLVETRQNQGSSRYLNEEIEDTIEEVVEETTETEVIDEIYLGGIKQHNNNLKNGGKPHVMSDKDEEEFNKKKKPEPTKDEPKVDESKTQKKIKITEAQSQMLKNLKK